VIRKIFQIILWLAAGTYFVVGILAITGALGSAREASSLGHAYAVFGSMILIIGATAAAATFLANKWRGWLILAPLILCIGLPILLFGAFWIDMEKGEMRRRALEEEMNSGRYAFGDQPALLAVAQAIRANDEEAIRAAAKNVPDLQAPGLDGTTLLCWAVRQTWRRPQLVQAVKTLLSLGADPNYTNGHRESYALAASVHGPAAGLQAMLEAGGDPNARNDYGWPIVFMHYKLGYYKDEERARLDLLLDHGADINSTVPESESEGAGYTLLLYTTQNGSDDSREYANALHLLERGAEPNRAGADGMTFGRMLTGHRAHFGRTLKPPPAEFAALWDWAEKHGIIQHTE
jgi:Ankyrin repeat